MKKFIIQINFPDGFASAGYIMFFLMPQFALRTYPPYQTYELLRMFLQKKGYKTV